MKGIRSFNKASLLQIVLCVVIGIGIFAVAFGFPVLNGLSDGWLYTSKRMQSEAAWLAYRNTPWLLPLGRLPQFFYPHGSSVAYMDGAPWYLTFLKIISFILPEWFSVWGTWLLVCCVLQVGMGYLFVRTQTKDRYTAWIGAVLCGISPVFIGRSVHLVLMAQWLLLCAWALFFNPQTLSRTKYLWLCLIALVSGIHPYLLAMVMTVRITALCLESEPLLMKARDLLASFVVSLCVLGLFGYFSNGSTKDVGEDVFVSDVTSFFNSAEHSSFLPAWNEAAGEDEGSGYLGAGGMILAFLGILSVIPGLKSKPAALNEYRRRRILTAFLLGTALTVFAFGPNIKYLGQPILSNPLYWVLNTLRLKSLSHIFRMPGRFVWPLYYLLIGVGCACLDKKRAILFLILLLQLIDLGPFLADSESRTGRGLETRIMRVRGNLDLFSSAKEIKLIPLEPRRACSYSESDESKELLAGLLKFSAEHNIPMNSGLQARLPLKVLEPLCTTELKDFQDRKFDDGIAYIVESDLVPDEFFGNSKELYCKKFHEFSVCATKRY